jgi:hypothetical protein
VYHAPVLLSNLESTVVKLLAALFYRSKRRFYHNRESLSSPNCVGSNSLAALPAATGAEFTTARTLCQIRRLLWRNRQPTGPTKRPADLYYHLLVSIIPRISLPTMRLLKVLTTIPLYQKLCCLSSPERLKFRGKTDLIQNRRPEARRTRPASAPPGNGCR